MQSPREQREADLVLSRIVELRREPIKGDFDADHLKAVHAYIFQDLPHHQPGAIRGDTPDWTKNRGLEGHAGGYPVPYVSRDVEGRIATVLRTFGGPGTLKGSTLDAGADRLAKLYGDLDHAHGFYEGNSRTLREFTRSLAATAGFRLDWTGTGGAGQERNALYVARDLAVYERAFPGLTEQKAMKTADRREYEAFFTMRTLKDAVGERTLSALMRDKLARTKKWTQSLIVKVPQKLEPVPASRPRQGRESAGQKALQKAGAHVQGQFQQQQADQIAEHNRQTARLRVQHRAQAAADRARDKEAVDRLRADIGAVDEREERALKAFDSRRESLAVRAAELMKGLIQGGAHVEGERADLQKTFASERLDKHRALDALKERQREAEHSHRREQAQARMDMMKAHRRERAETLQRQERDEPRLAVERLQAMQSHGGRDRTLAHTRKQ